jgi:hypothetical protein
VVIYTGYLNLRVKRVLDAVDEITGITSDKGGYVESLSSNVIVVRIPAVDFESVMAEFAALGDVLEKEVNAMDVSDRYTDLNARLTIAREAKERLLKLLEKVTQVKERLSILQEIKRLSEKIESIAATLSAIENLADYFTITLELTPVVQNSYSQIHRSPFDWVKSLVPQKTTLFGGIRHCKIDLPDEFVLFDKEKDFRAQAADTTVIRGGVVKNDPAGDNRFWQDAVAFEMEGRGEIAVEFATIGSVAYSVYRNDDIKPRYYLVGLLVKDKKIYVFEVFYPHEQAFKTHNAAIVKSFKTAEVR